MSPSGWVGEGGRCDAQAGDAASQTDLGTWPELLCLLLTVQSHLRTSLLPWETNVVQWDTFNSLNLDHTIVLYSILYLVVEYSSWAKFVYITAIIQEVYKKFNQLSTLPFAVCTLCKNFIMLILYEKIWQQGQYNMSTGCKDFYFLEIHRKSSQHKK